MTRSAIYPDAARGLLGAFIGRNNDVGGYWALGKLYAHARRTGVSTVTVDLVQSTLSPPDSEFDGMLRWLRGKFAHQLIARGIPVDRVSAAEITVHFTGQKGDSPWGDVFECRATLVNNLGRAHSASSKGACWVHDPFRERKRAIPYGGA